MKIAKGFGGYQVSEVDSYIIRLLTGYQKSLDDLKAEFEALSAENGRLAAEIRSTSNELEGFKARSKVWVAAEAEARRSARQMEETARYNAEQITTNVQAEVEVHKAYLATLDSEIARAKQEIETFVESVRAFLSYATPKETSAAVSRPAGSSGSKVAGWILGGGTAEDMPTARGVDGSLRVNTAGDSLKVVAQNGTVVGQVSSLVLDGASGKVTGYEIVKSAVPNAVPDGTVIPASCVIAVRSDRLIVSTSLLGGVAKVSPSPPPQVSVPEAETAKPGEPQPERPVPPGEERSEAEREVEQAIRQSQLKYVIGKISGRDIVGDDGTLVVSKGQEITHEVVEKADAQGKLAELIVYMLTPDMSLDEDETSASEDLGAEHMVS
ncbi:MAG: hypothetical protein AB1700_17060 [Bacillota bacterium]